MHLYDLLKKYSDFSIVERKPLFWILLGPLSIILSFALSISSPWFPCLTVFGILASLKWKIPGFIVTSAAFALYFLLQGLFSEEKNFLWEIGKGISLLLGILVFYLSLEEVKQFFQNEKQNMDTVISDLQLSFAASKEASNIEKTEAEKNIQSLNEKIKKMEDEVQSLLSLVDATCSESDRIYKQNDFLSAESLNHYREIAALTLSIKKCQNQIKEAENILFATEEESKKRLEELNRYRVEYFQLQLITTSLQTDLKKYRNVILNQRDLLKAIKDNHTVEKKQPEQMTFFPPAFPSKEQSQMVTLKTLEKEKVVLKKIYDHATEENKTLKEELKRIALRLSKATSTEDSFRLEKEEINLQGKLEEKKSEMEQAKAALIRQEREIFVIKKGMQEQGVSASSCV